jgi:peptidoglycan/LPS O-acetylase OafA/YrhL
MIKSQPQASARAPIGTPVSARFEVLDSWRGIAAVMVVLFHSQVSSHIWPIPLVRAGEAFVDFFFVLSGFVIANAYAAHIASARDFGRFIVLRFGRVYPLHLVMLALFVAVECAKALMPGIGDPVDPAFSGSNTPGSMLTNLLLLQAMGIHDTLTWNTPSWSISGEVFAYLLFGFGALLAGRRLWVVAAAAAGLSLTLLMVCAPEGMQSAHDFGAARALYGFSIGVVLHQVAIRGLSRARARMVENGGRTALDWTLAELLAVACVALIVVDGHNGAMAYAAPVVFAFAILVFSHEAGWLSRMLRHRFLLLLGMLSYSIYMIHMFVEIRFVNIARLAGRLLDTDLLAEMGNPGERVIGIDLGNAFLGDLVILTLLVCVVSLSYLSYRFVEAPGRKHFRALGERLFGSVAGEAGDKKHQAVGSPGLQAI